MRTFLILLLLCTFIVFAGCSSEVAKETTKETIKSVSQAAEEGIEKTSQNIEDAKPYIKEDLQNLKENVSEGFWESLEAIEILMEGESVKDIPTPAEILQMQRIHSAVNRGLVKSAEELKNEASSETEIAFLKLREVLQQELARNTQPDSVDASGFATPSTEIRDKSSEKLDPEKLKEAWETLGKFANRPDTARHVFGNVEKFTYDHPELNIQAGIVGPVAKEKIGKKATEFLAKLNIGEVSETVKFKNGYLIVQLINDTGEKVEVGYVYIPGKKQ